MVNAAAAAGLSNESVDSENATSEGTPPDLELESSIEPSLGVPTSAETAAAATPATPQPGPQEFAEDTTSPAPQFAINGAATTEWPVAEQRARQHNLKIFEDCEEPSISTNYAATNAADSSFMEKAISQDCYANEFVPPPFRYDVAFEGDEEKPKKQMRAIRATPPSGAGQEVEELATDHQLTPEVNIDGGEHDNADDPIPESAAVLPTNLEQGDSTVRVPEAWPVTNDDIETAHLRNSEVFIAKPFLPWWEKERTRLNAWALLCLFSAIVFIAYETDDYVETREDVSRANSILIMTCLTLSLSFSILFILAHFGSSALSKLVGTILEGVVALILLGLWVGAMLVIMDPSKDYGKMYVPRNEEEAFNHQATIRNANLYFGTWGALLCALTVLEMFTWEKLGRSSGTKWCFLLLTSVIVIIESLMFYFQHCSIAGGADDVTCNRNKYGVVAGCIGLVICPIMSFFNYLGKDSTVTTTIAGFAMAVNYTICAGLLCFGKGPATYAGSQYFWAWAGFFVSSSVFVNSLKEFLRLRGEKIAARASVAETGGETMSQENHEQ